MADDKSGCPWAGDVSAWLLADLTLEKKPGTPVVASSAATRLPADSSIDYRTIELFKRTF